MRLISLVFLALMGTFTPAHAHDVPPSMLMLDIGRRTIDVELQLQLTELGAGLGMPLASDPNAVIADHGGQIRQYIETWFHVRARDGRPYALKFDSLGMRRTRNANWTGNDWLDVRLTLSAPDGASTESFTLDYSVIIQRVLSHQAMVYVRRDLRNDLLGDKPLLIGVMGFGKTQLQVDGSDGSWWRGFARLYCMGMRHIAQGADHLLFLLTLLLPAPQFAVRGRWRAQRSPASIMRSIVNVVSGFTVGHSLTLAITAAGWIHTPGSWVEILIAVSILVSSIHAWRPLFAGREIWIASVFGLIHGMAFADTLSGLNFDGFTLALSLIGFNLGIESMQLLVVAVVLPVMILLGATRIYGIIRALGAAFSAICALGWIAERAFQATNPMQAVADWMTAPPAWAIISFCAFSAVSMCLRIAMSRS